MSLFFASMAVVAVHVFYYFFTKISFKMTQNFTRAGGGGWVDCPLEPLLNLLVQEVYRTVLSVI